MEEREDAELRERCVNIAWQMATSGCAEINTFQMMLETADALFKYIKSGVKGE